MAAGFPVYVQRLRRAFVWTHRWLGLSFGIIVVLVGLTGSFIVFYREIDAALNPALYASVGPEQRVTFSQAMRAAAQVDAAPITSVVAPDRIWPVWVVIHSHPTKKGSYPNLWTTMIDPSSGRVLGRRDYTNAFAFSIYRLHYTLLLYKWWGKEFVGAIGLALLASTLSGLYLWWPKRSRFWRSISARRDVSPQRFMVDLHKTVGFWMLIALVVISATGIGLIFPEAVRPVVSLPSPATPYISPQVEVPPPKGTPLLSADAIVTMARAAKPGQEIAVLKPPVDTRNPWRVLFRPAAGTSPALRSRGTIWLDPWTGAIMLDRTSDTMSMGDRYMTEQLWIHNGAALGFVGRLFVFISGLAPLILFVTGYTIWFNRRLARKAMPC
jgi:uncharacterized iron-regulated membrane protein